MPRHVRQPVRIHSENRDERWVAPLRRAADQMEQVLGTLARRDDGSLERAIAKLGLGNPAGPTRLEVPESRAAWDLALELGWRSVEGLRDGLAQLPPTTVGNGWRLLLPKREVDRLPPETRFGIPLLALSSADALNVLPRMLAARQLPSFAQMHQFLDQALASVLAIEDWLWELAEQHGGAAARIPYAFRVRALTWFWSPAAHRNGLRAPTLCLRCGWFMAPVRPIASPPRCKHCQQEPPETREWPAHAIGPAERGTWWLECRAAGCDNLFVARRQARRCPACRSAATTPAKRRPLTEAKRAAIARTPGLSGRSAA